MAPPVAQHQLAGEGDDRLRALSSGDHALAAAPTTTAASGAPAPSAALPLDKAIDEINFLPDALTPAQRRYNDFLESAKRRLEVGDFSGTLGELDQAIRLDPGDPRGWIAQAVTHNKLKAFPEAAGDARSALRLDAKSAAAWDQLAWSLFKQGRYQEAVDAANHALALDPNDAFGYAIRARAKWGLGDKLGALADAQAAARLDPRFQSLADATRNGLDITQDNLAPGDIGIRWKKLDGLPGLLALLLLAACAAAGWLLTRRGGKKARTFTRLVPGRHDDRLAGKYELGRVLGTGGMGQVFEAVDHSLNRKVAIKKVSSAYTAGSPRARKLFINEARTVASLHHPNIVDIYEIVDTGSELFLVFELVCGKTVEQLLAEAKPGLGLEHSVEILRPVCQALAFAHGRNLVHRDLKPANIMVTAEGFVKLMDFGVARSMGTPGMKRPVDQAQTQTIMGTPYFMAPEMEQGIVSKEGDVYALGVCAYRMVTGRYPFSTLEQKLVMDFAAASRVVPGLPPELDELLISALHPDPTKRLRTPREFARGLEKALSLTPRS